MSVEAYPLQWPAGRARRVASARRDGRFRSSRDNGRAEITIAEALKRLQLEIDRIGGRYAVISTNVETRLDGLPRSDRRAPDDPGVALYFQLAGKPHCMPCDTYTKVAHNIAAIAAHIEATRAIERHGVASVSEMFAGFVALPAPKSPWDILGVPRNSSANEVNRAFRAKAATAHPDVGGSHEAMAELTAARDAALSPSSPDRGRGG